MSSGSAHRPSAFVQSPAVRLMLLWPKSPEVTALIEKMGSPSLIVERGAEIPFLIGSRSMDAHGTTGQADGFRCVRLGRSPLTAITAERRYRTRCVASIDCKPRSICC